MGRNFGGRLDSYDIDPLEHPSPTWGGELPDLQPSTTKDLSGIWQYGEEASLYSIAEDSREDHVSVASPGGLAAKDALRGNAWVFGSFWPQEQDEKPEQQQEEVREQHPASNHSLPSAMGVELSIAEDAKSFSDGSGEILYLYPRRRRWCRIMGGACVLCLVLLAGALATAFLWPFGRNRGSSDTSTTSSIEKSTETEATGLSMDEEDTMLLLSENYVFNSIKECPGTSDLFDTTTKEGIVFAALVDEVYSHATTDETTGSVTFNELHGAMYLRERFALEVLYHSTMGDTWLRHDSWMNANDPCDGWSGVECASPRQPPACAVTGIYLGTSCPLSEVISEK